LWQTTLLRSESSVKWFRDRGLGTRHDDAREIGAPEKKVSTSSEPHRSPPVFPDLIEQFELNRFWSLLLQPRAVDEHAVFGLVPCCNSTIDPTMNPS
jgi:hypothetical protein